MQSLVQLISKESTPLTPIPTDTQPLLPKQTGIKCVLFDVYGTLMVSGVGDISHSSDDNRKSAIAAVMEKLGISIKPTIEDHGDAFKAIILQHQGKQRDAGVQYPEVDIREVWLDFLSTYCTGTGINSPQHPLVEELSIRFELTVNPTWPMPALDTTLNQIHQNGVLLGIVSNAQFFTPLLFNAYLGKSLKGLGFLDSICQWSFIYKEAKPSEKLYRINAQVLKTQHNLLPSEVLYVGNDMLNDIKPASAAGFKTALFAGDRRSLRLRTSDERIHGIKPDLIIHSLEDILHCI